MRATALPLHSRPVKPTCSPSFIDSGVSPPPLALMPATVRENFAASVVIG